MKKSILLALFAASITLIPIVSHQKVFGKSDFQLTGNRKGNISQSGISQSSAFGYIQTRNGRIAINQDKSFTIYDNNGKVVTENISLEQLKAENPDLYDLVKDSIASQTLMMDAGINLNNLPSNLGK